MSAGKPIKTPAKTKTPRPMTDAKPGRARKASTPKKSARASKRPSRSWRWYLLRTIGIAFGLTLGWIVLLSVVSPPAPYYIRQETARLGMIDWQWSDFSEIAPVMARSVVAAEDANFCLHWGFDMTAIREAINDGAERGASTISQQVVKNLFLWPESSWTRKALEGVLTPIVEALWSKERILETYLNLAEFDEGVFGIEPAARHYFNTGPENLTPRQAAVLAALLPSPKTRDATKPSPFVIKRATAIADGAATIAKDGRDGCFKRD